MILHWLRAWKEMKAQVAGELAQERVAKEKQAAEGSNPKDQNQQEPGRIGKVGGVR